MNLFSKKQLPSTLSWLVLAALVSVSSTAYAASNLVINQTDNPDPVPAGGNVTYTVGVANSGTTAATGVTLSDTLPSGSTFVSATAPSGGSCSQAGGVVSCNLPDVPTGGSTVNTTIVVTLPTSGAYTNNASVSSPDNSPNTVDAQPQNTTAVAAADLQMNITSPTAGANVVAGQTYNYVTSITNNGPDQVESGGQIKVSFDVPTGASITGFSGSGWSCSPSSGYPLSSGTITCAHAGPLASGATSSNLTFTAAANATGSIGAAFSASATKTNGDAMPDANLGNNTASVSVNATPGSDVSITGSSSPNPVAQGSNVTYTLHPRFNGGIQPGSTGSNTITVTSTLGSGLTYVPASASGTGWSCSASGQTITCTRPGPYTGGNYTNMPAITLQATANTTGTLNNDVSITIPETDPNTVNNNTTIGVNSSNDADLRIIKSASLNPVVVGQAFNYTINVRNLGLLAVGAGQTITVTDNIPAGTTVTALPSGSGWTCTGTGAGPVTVTCTRSGPLNRNTDAPNITIPAQITTAGATSNTASVALTGTGPVDNNSGNNTSTVNGTATASGNEADLSLTKTASGDVDAGQPLTYTLTVKNAGPGASTNVTLSDSLNSLINNGGLQSITASQGTCTPAAPANGTSQNVSCNLGTINSGGSATVSITVLPNIAVTGPRTNTASVTSPDIGDPDRTNNTASATSQVTAVADITVAKSATPSPVHAGAPLTYVATITNNGPSSAQAVTMTDTLPTNASFIDVQNVSNGGTCGTQPNPGDTGGQLVCNWSTAVASGSQRTVTYRVRPLTSAVGSNVDNSVAVTTSTKESDTTNNSATTSTPVDPVQLDVLINKSVSNPSVPLGGTTTYTVTVTNNGPSEATGVVMTDSYPDPAANYPITPPAHQTTAAFSYQGGLSVNHGGTCTEPSVGATTGELTCTFPTLDQGETATITYDMKAESITQAGSLSGQMTNFASVKPNETETIPVNNNYASQTTSTYRSSSNADLAITKTLTTPSNGTLIPGNDAVYDISVVNNGPDTSQSAQAIDVLPTGLTFVSAPGCAFDSGTNTVSCDLGTMNNGDTKSFTVTTKVNQPYDGVNPLVNEAEADAPGDPDTTNNKSSVSSKVFGFEPIPTLSEWALALLAMMIGVIAVGAYQRRNR